MRRNVLNWLSAQLDKLSEYLAHRKGLLPMIGMGLIALNLLFQFLFGSHWIATSNFFLHLGILIAIFGILLAWAL
ncbi:MAG: hypothetical protein J7555_05605 [Chloroflexi bacterium]|jgi:hypothetical protein|nr:hypothetical protein [Chloroflexota bacterium]